MTRAQDVRAAREDARHREAMTALEALIHGLERQGTALERQGAALEAALERQGTALERQGAALERQGTVLEAALKGYRPQESVPERTHP